MSPMRRPDAKIDRIRSSSIKLGHNLESDNDADETRG